LLLGSGLVVAIATACQEQMLHLEQAPPSELSGHDAESSESESESWNDSLRKAHSGCPCTFLQEGAHFRRVSSQYFVDDGLEVLSIFPAETTEEVALIQCQIEMIQNIFYFPVDGEGPFPEAVLGNLSLEEKDVLFMVIAQGNHGAVIGFCALFGSSEDGNDFMEVMRRLCVSSPFWAAVAKSEHHVDQHQLEHHVAFAEPHVPQDLCAEDILPKQVVSVNFFLGCMGIKTTMLGTMHLAEVGCTSYISAYGYAPKDEDLWQVASVCQSRPEPLRPTFQANVQRHVEGADHTWYLLESSLLLDRPPHRLDWLAPRRLAHIRQYLYVPVKAAFGEEYNKQFAKVGFAQRMGPRGTTKKLGKWLSALAATINSRIAPPRVVALTLHFLEAPCLS